MENSREDDQNSLDHYDAINESEEPEQTGVITIALDKAGNSPSPAQYKIVRRRMEFKAFLARARQAAKARGSTQDHSQNASTGLTYPHDSERAETGKTGKTTAGNSDADEITLKPTVYKPNAEAPPVLRKLDRQPMPSTKTPGAALATVSGLPTMPESPITEILNPTPHVPPSAATKAHIAPLASRTNPIPTKIVAMKPLYPAAKPLPTPQTLAALTGSKPARYLDRVYRSLNEVMQNQGALRADEHNAPRPPKPLGERALHSKMAVPNETNSHRESVRTDNVRGPAQSQDILSPQDRRAALKESISPPIRSQNSLGWD